MNNLNATTKSSNLFFKVLSWIIIGISVCLMFSIFMFAPKLIVSKQGKAAYQTAMIYGLANNYKQEIIWMQKAIAEGNSDAPNELGVMYARGTGVEENMEKAKTLYKMAADRGSYYGMYNLGLAYSNLNHRTTRVASQSDLKLAVYWYQKSMKEGSNYCAPNDLGILYATGAGVNKNPEKAKDYFRKSGSIYILQSINTEDAKHDDMSTDYTSLKFDLLKLYSEYQLLQAQHSDSSIAFQNIPPEVIKKVKDLSSKITNDCWQ